MAARSGFESFSRTEEDVFLSLFARDSDSDDEGEKGNVEEPIKTTDGAEDQPDFTENTYSTPTTVGGAIDVVLIERKKLGIAHQLWPAAQFLCNYIGKVPETVQNERIGLNILELGAGVGLCGLFVGKLFESGHIAQKIETKVILTDLNVAVPGLQENIDRNNLSSTVLARELCWGNESHLDAVMAEFQSIPLVLAADCVYWECLFEPLFLTVKALAERGCKIIIAHVRRWKKDGKFFAMCKKAKLRVSTLVEEVLTVPHEHTGEPTRQVTRIYCIEKESL